jgi:hypothetical protein
MIFNLYRGEITMNQYKDYYKVHQFDLLKFENIEEKKVIHQFENKNTTVDTENLKDQYVLNHIR